MALINCPECGKEISDKAVYCPNCGFPIEQKINEKVETEYDKILEENESYELYTENNDEDIEEEEQKMSPLSIVALILSITLFFSIFGLVIAIIDLKMPNGKNKKLSKWAIGICCFWVLIIIIPSNRSEKKSYTQEAKTTSAETHKTTESQYNTDKINENIEIIDEQNLEQTPQSSEITYEDIFFYNLMDNVDQYNGKYIRTVIQVYRCYQSESEAYIQSQYSDYNLVKNSDNITIYPDNYQEFQSGEYITVEGRLAKNGNDDVLVNAHIVDSGENSQNTFESDLAVRLEEQNQNLQQEKDSFIESCVSVSYEELRRYPDTYQDTPIKLTIYIKDVEPDGLIFLGDIIATMNGEELAVYDDRIEREPRIIEGETITIYATGNGLATMKVKQKGVVFNKTVDEYEVPAVKIKYTENDKDFIENN
ncbi:MAG: zinc ribbon domain-containing protein [Clostridium sp.]|nr:zinc ribbon domain-containing protein [Clostridium sp.]